MSFLSSTADSVVKGSAVPAAQKTSSIPFLFSKMVNKRGIPGEHRDTLLKKLLLEIIKPLWHPQVGTFLNKTCQH
jgi:hypothetical protein